MSARPKGKVLLRAKSLVEPDVQNPFSYRLQLTALDKVKVSQLNLNMLKFRNTFPVLDIKKIVKELKVSKMHYEKKMPQNYILSVNYKYAVEIYIRNNY